MERYKILGEIGDGTCGCVYKAVNLETSEIVAVKKMKRKFHYWEECVNLREVKSLRRLNHRNIIKLFEIVKQNDELFFIFEYMEYNLYQIMKDRQTSFSEEEIRGFISQVLQGLTHVHKNGYFHRDLKPENLLVTNDLIKIADFGLARELSSSPPFTDYVSTRWYRAPEVLLRSSYYTPAIDMWAVGAIMAELFTLSPVFPGESEFDQLYKICCVLGQPDWKSFPVATNVSLVDICLFDILPSGIAAVIPNASSEAINLIEKLFSWDPLQRPSADQCLQHPFFQVATPQVLPRPRLDLSLGTTVFGDCLFERSDEPNLELNLWDFDKKSDDDDCYLGLTLAVNPSNEFGNRRSHCVKRDHLVYPAFVDPQQHSWSSLFVPNQQIMAAAASVVDPSLSLSSSFSPAANPSSGQSTGGFSRTLLANHHHHHYHRR